MGPKNTPPSIGASDMVVPQGMLQTSSIVKKRCPALSITRLPATPAMLQPRLIKNEHMLLPCKWNFSITLLNTKEMRAM